MTLGNILFLVFIGVVIYMMMKSGGGCCGSHDHGGKGGRDGHDQADRGNPADEHQKGMEFERTNIIEKDPVCGMKVNDIGIESSHRGRTFHFCSEQCKKLFTLNPNKYAGA